MSTKSKLNINGRVVDVSNLDKVFYPKTGFTKGQVIDYYINISPHLLPHLKGRPVTLKRYPNGVEGFFFYEKQIPASHPDWVKTTNVKRKDGSEINYCVFDSLPVLVWAANLADLELHTFLHRAPAIDTPTMVAFDLDPGSSADIVLCCKVGLWLKDLFAKLKLESFAKTSGSKGLQVYVPLNTRVTYDQTKTFAHAVAETLEHEFPETVVSKMQKHLRGGKVLVDWSQNDPHKTTVCVYSLRAKEHPTVSTPVTWDEVAMTLKKKNVKLLTLKPATFSKARVKKAWRPFRAGSEVKTKTTSIQK